MQVLSGNSGHDVFTNQPASLTGDLFLNLFDMSTAWTRAVDTKCVFEGRDRAPTTLNWTGSRVDLVVCSTSQLRALPVAYASDDSRDAFVCDSVAASSIVMNVDRFDLG
jgi:catalase-peroxidase